ncbi:hypothetical protein [Neorhodopirellula pilleata]|nr:hypothetical protein [Neorhodopirellula pilleata]
MNPYHPPDIQSQPTSAQRLHWFAFASTATIAFGVVSWISHSLRADSRPFIATPTQFVASYVPYFAFSGAVGAVNLLSPMRGYFVRSPVSVRLIAGMILGLMPIPLNHIIVNYLWYLKPFVPFKVAEIAIVVIVPVIICTAIERLFLRFRKAESVTSAIS